VAHPTSHGTIQVVKLEQVAQRLWLHFVTVVPSGSTKYPSIALIHLFEPSHSAHPTEQGTKQI